VSQSIPETKEKKKKQLYRWFRRLLRTIAVIVILLVLLVLFVRSPWGQDIIVGKLIEYVSEKTNTEVRIDKFFITFEGDLQLDGLYLEDQKGDTLVYSRSLEADVPLWKTITGEAVGVESLEWEGLRTNIIRKDSLSGFNFQFLIDAFASENSETENPEKSEPVNLVLGDFNLSDFDITYNDAVSGIETEVIIGKFDLRLKTIDLENLAFITEQFNLENSNIKFHLNPVSTSENTENNSTLPKLTFDNFRLDNITADINTPDININTRLKKFYAEIPNIDLSKERYLINSLELKDSRVDINLINKENTGEAKDDADFQWPTIDAELTEVIFDNNTITYSVNDAKPVKNKFNPDAIELLGLNVQLKDILLRENSAGFNLNDLKFTTTSGFDFKKLVGNFKLDNQQLSAKNLDLKLNQNLLTGNIALNFIDFQSFLKKPEKAGIRTEISNLNLSLKDLFKIRPELSKNPYLRTISEKFITGVLSAKGTTEDLDVSNFKLNWGENTKFSAQASLQNISSTEAFQFNIAQYSLTTNRTDIDKFIEEKELGISIPETFKLNGDLSGNFEEVRTKSLLESSQGIVSLEGELNNAEDIRFNTTLSIENYRLDDLLQNPKFGLLSLELSADGEGSTMNTIDAALDLKIKTIDFNEYKYENLVFNGVLNDGNGEFTSNYKDKNLNYDLKTTVDLDTTNISAKINLGLKGVDLSALGFMNRNIKTGFDLDLNLSQKDETYTLNTDIKNGVVVYDNRSYLLGSLKAAALFSKDTTSLSIDNKILDLELKANTNPEGLNQSLVRHIRGYLTSKPQKTDTISKSTEVYLKGRIAQSPLLNKVFFVNVKDLDTINVSMDFNEKERKLKANITAPYINYSGNEIDSLKFSMLTNAEKFKFDLGFKNIKSGPLDIPRTSFTGSKKDKSLALNFKASKDEKILYYVKSDLSFKEKETSFSVKRDSLLLNGEPWLTAKNNKVIFKEDSVAFSNFIFNRKEQSVRITDKLQDYSKPHLAFEFENFKLSEILYYLNPQDRLVEGILDGDFIIEDPLKDTGIVTNLKIDQLEVLKANLGQLSLNGRSIDNKSYEFDAGISGGNINLDFEGNYSSANDSPNLNMTVNLNEVKMKAVENLSMGEISDGKGTINGNFQIEFEADNNTYKGQLNFDNAGFKVDRLNAAFSLKDETLDIDDEGIKMNNFRIKDEGDNTLSISGEITTDNFVNPGFDLSFKAKDFKILEASDDDNSSFYGTAVIDVDGTVKGDLQIPDVDASLKINSETDFIYVLPASAASVEKREGVVRFVNREDPDQILTRTDTKSGAIIGFDINSFIKVDRAAKFSVILDKNTGDNFKVQGKGDLNFQMFPNGRINLSGFYEASSGQYKLSLYNLVKRKFLLAPGSRVTWNGDPFNAKLDVRAIYNVEASAYSLMSPQISGLDPSVKSKYRQVLPFEVYLNIDGELMQPEISFELDMPEDERGAIGGQIYSRVKQVNQQEAELSQQVFSLLVLNRFYPSSGSDGSSGGIQTLAQENINDAISDQLNAFSDKILGKSGFELDFGLDSYTDYQGEAPAQRTQLNVAAQKKLLNDRLTVRVGSEIDVDDNRAPGDTTPMSGNVSIVYELTKDGRYKIKGFRRNRFENIIDGQTIVSGIALIFTKEFNKFDELWSALLKTSLKNDESKQDESNNSKTKQNLEN
jgi:hypothetical protein